MRPLTAEELGLASPPRVEIYRDFIFISFNPTVESLVDYLAGARQYLDLVCDQSEAGMEIVTGTQAYSMRANWKLLVENSMDGYHARTTHQRYFEFLIETGVDPSRMRGRRGGCGQSPGQWPRGHPERAAYGAAQLRAGPQCSAKKKGRTGGDRAKNHRALWRRMGLPDDANQPQFAHLSQPDHQRHYGHHGAHLFPGGPGLHRDQRLGPGPQRRKP